MKTKTVWILNGVWLVAATAAYSLGRHNAGQAGGADGTTSAAIAPANSGSRTMTRPKEAAKSTPDEESPQEWAARFRGENGKISSGRISTAMVEALRDPDQARSMIRFSQLLKEMTPENAAAAFKTVRETVVGWEAMRYLPMLNDTWGAIDGPGAMAAMKNLNGQDAWFASNSVLAGFASTDPEGAKKWLDENSTADQGRGDLERAYVAGLARNDIDAALRYVESLPQDQRGAYMDQFVERKIKDGIGEAADWASALGDPAMKASALERVAREYANQTPQEAFLWAGTLTNAENQGEIYGRVFREWGRSDPGAAAETLNTMATGAEKDSAISSYTRSIARQDPQNAITWANSIADTASREAAQIETVQRWRWSDAEAADKWAAANLSAEAQAKAAQNPPRRGWGDW